MRQAVIEIGTNSIKCTVAVMQREKTLLPLVDRVNVSRLGEGLSGRGSFGYAAMERSLQAVMDFVHLAQEQKAQKIVIVGTMALRTADNAGVFNRMVKKACGREVRVLTGVEEAWYAYLAVLGGLPSLPGPLLVFDVGGGSTELITGQDGVMKERVSLDIGAVSLHESFFSTYPLTEEKKRLASRTIQEIFMGQKIRGMPHLLVGMGGNVTTMGAVMKGLTRYDPGRIQGLVLTKKEVERQQAMYLKKGVEERRRIPGLDPKRADIILASTYMVQTILELYQGEEFIISDYGVRHGLLLEVFQKGRG